MCKGRPAAGVVTGELSTGDDQGSHSTSHRKPLRPALGNLISREMLAKTLLVAVCVACATASHDADLERHAKGLAKSAKSSKVLALEKTEAAKPFFYPFVRGAALAPLFAAFPALAGRPHSIRCRAQLPPASPGDPFAFAMRSRLRLTRRRLRSTGRASRIRPRACGPTPSRGGSSGR